MWVALVIKNIHQGVDDGWNLAAVEAEIDDLYRHLLRSTSDSQKKRAHRPICHSNRVR